MISHVVLMKPRTDLNSADRRALVTAFERAVREIPSVRGVRVGRRVTFGAGYESGALDAGDYVAIIDFDDLAGLKSYLQHPAHEELGARLTESLAAVLVYDFEVGGVEALHAGWLFEA